MAGIGGTTQKKYYPVGQVGWGSGYNPAQNVDDDQQTQQQSGGTTGTGGSENTMAALSSLPFSQFNTSMENWMTDFRNLWDQTQNINYNPWLQT